MVYDKKNSLTDLNKNIWRNIVKEENFYEKFLDSNFPNWRKFQKKEVDDNVRYYEGEKLRFSFRLDSKLTTYKHIDIFLKNSIKPYRRIFLKNSMITKHRYYEYDTWEKNYDVIFGSEQTAVYTVEYYGNKERFIDLYYKPGYLFYDKSRFLSYMFHKMEN